MDCRESAALPDRLMDQKHCMFQKCFFTFPVEGKILVHVKSPVNLVMCTSVQYSALTSVSTWYVVGAATGGGTSLLKDNL
jgi:hypothetical protein